MVVGIKVGDVMTRNFIYVKPGTDLKTCAKTMIKKKVGSLIIKNQEDILLGIITEKDIIWALVKKSQNDLGKIYVQDLMKRRVITIKPSADIAEALAKIKKFKVRRLPVLENKKVIGMITLKDILKLDPSLYEMISEIEKIREESKKLKSKRRLAQDMPKTKEGACPECGAQGVLYKTDEGYLCESCLGPHGSIKFF